VLDSIRPWAESELGIELQTEGSGSQAACRKLTELGRQCDLLMLADAPLVGGLCRDFCDWRLDFATDEIVLGVGARAPWIPDAEINWPEALFKPDVRLARVDENQAPIGYRTMLVLKLTEQTKPVPGLLSNFLSQCKMVVDDVSRLAPLLKSGEIDYAFIYRSTAWANELRHIPLDPRVNLGSPLDDYSNAEVTFEALTAGTRRRVTVRGEYVVWTLSIPRGANSEAALRFVDGFLNQPEDPLSPHGLKPLRPPRFYGPKPVWEEHFDRAQYAGELAK